jgi:hypothetical protein
LGDPGKTQVVRVIRKRIRKKGDGIDIAADVNAVIAVNDGGGRSRTSVSSRQTVVQRSEDPDVKGKEQGQNSPEGEG